MPIEKNCDILKEYCRFIEIVEQNYNNLFPKKSFKKAIELAMAEGILKDYLDRKTREVINMLCAKYDYKMDIAVKQEEAFKQGKTEGKIEGKTEVAKKALKMKMPTEQIAQMTGLTIEEIQSLEK